MKLEFDGVADLQEFLDFVYSGRGVPQGSAAHNEIAKPLIAVVDTAAETATDIAPDNIAYDVNAEIYNNAPAVTPIEDETKPKRTRRTKAQILANETETETETKDWPFAPIAPEQAAPAPAPAPALNIQAADIDAKLYIAERAPRLGNIAPVPHLSICRQFIAVHSMAPYARTMQLVEGTGDVATYSDDQRAQHVAAMEFINKARGGVPLAHEQNPT